MELSHEARAELARHLATIRDSLSAIEGVLGLDGPAAGQIDVDVLPAADRPVGLEIGEPEPLGKFTYRWPGGTVKYPDAVKYTARRSGKEDVFAVGAEEGGRASYGREDRGRVVVFHRRGTSEMSYYPLVEFAESDLDSALFAAIVPQLADPKKGATAADLDALRDVPHLNDAQLERADAVFRSVRNGPSLRVLVRRDEPEMMIEHAWWVGSLRGTTG
ncbi:hypothetical protein [Micromonospora chalcea]|uniref:hypothetical protein n=1 Tax=Micromonospora chalcea TaxID=1874 RepID=UPI003808EE65